MFSYSVMSEQEAMTERYQLLKPGEYDAVILTSEDRVSKTGNPMMDITLQVFDDEGRARNVRDFLVFTPAMMWKVVHFSSSAGLTKLYEEGKLCSNVAIGNRIRVKIGIEEGKEIPADKLKVDQLGAKYPDKNKVEDYVKKENATPNTEATEPFQDDDIQF